MVRRVGRFVAFASLFSIVVGALAIIGWAFSIEVLKSVFPRQVVIKPNAAAALLLCGCSLWLLRSAQPAARIKKLAGQVVAAVVAALGLLSLLEHLVGWHLGIDQSLFRDQNPWDAFGSVRPGLMAPITALDFLLIGLALLLLDWTVSYRSQLYVPAQVLAFAANTAAVLGLLDFLLGAHRAYTHIALQTAVGLFVLSFAVPCARTTWGLGALFVSASYGGTLTRRLWPAAVVTPPLIGTVSWKAYSAGLLSEWSGITLMIIAMITLLAGLTVWSAQSIDRSDTERRRGEDEIRKLNIELEQRVRARTADLEAALEREVKIGFRIQQMLLLTQPPTDLPGLQVAALTIPSQRIDGDFYDFFKHESQCLDVMVADVMGKGIPAALVAAATKSNFLEALCHLIALSRSGTLPEPRAIVTLAHADMVRQLIDLESFVTLSYARFDLNRRRVDLVDCGHTGMLVVRAETGASEIVHGNNLPLGIREGEIFDQLSVSFVPGDLFLFYSDGITEMRDLAGELYGEERLLECVRLNRELEPEALVDAIRKATVAFARSDRLVDDLTCVVVKIGDAQEPLAHAEREIGSGLSELAHAREFVREFCCALPEGLLSADEVSALELAVNEAASNIMKHAYRGRADQRIQLEASRFPGHLSIKLHHLGEPIDVAVVSPPALDGSRESGFGVYLIEKIVDEARYSRDERGRNCTTLIKALNHQVQGRSDANAGRKNC